MGLWDNFTLGLAGIGDALGITDDEAAQVYASQTATAQGLSASQTSQLLTQTTAAEDSGDILGPAATATANQIGAAASNAVTGAFSVFNGVVTVVIVVGIVVGLFYFAPIIKPIVSKAGKAIGG